METHGKQGTDVEGYSLPQWTIRDRLHVANSDGDGLSECSGDCHDGNPAVHPGASDVCDGMDNDCDPATDEMADGDGDGPSACQGDRAPI